MSIEVFAPKKNIILDATVFSTFMSCARLTDFRFNMDLVSTEGKSTSLEMGSTVHVIFETYFKDIIAGVPRIDAIGNALEAGQRYADEEAQNCSDQDIKLVFDTMDQYFEHYKNDYWIPLEVEHVKQAIIYEDDECRIMWKAKLDLTVDTNNGIYPVDHKTMKQRRDTVSLNNQFMGQCLLMKTRSVIINKVGFQTSLKPSEKFTRPLVNYTFNQLTEWSQVIVPFWSKLFLSYADINYWPPNFTHCENKYGFCAFKKVCEADPVIREETLRLHFIKGDKWDVSNSEE